MRIATIRQNPIAIQPYGAVTFTLVAAAGAVENTVIRRTRSCSQEEGENLYAGAVHLGLVAVVVSEYDPAIRFFVDLLGFELAEDSPALTNDGRPKRWVVVRPPGAETGLLLAQADGDDQASAVGKYAGGRVGFFLHVADFDVAYRRMASAGVQFVTEPRAEPYGCVAVFLDIAGNRWDLIGPAPRSSQFVRDS